MQIDEGAERIDETNARRLRRGVQLGRKPRRPGRGQALAFSQSGSHLASLQLGGEEMLQCWSWRGRDWSESLALPAQGATALALGAAGDEVLLAGGGQLKLISLPKGKVLRDAELDLAVRDLHLSPEGTRLLASGNDGQVFLWDVASWSLIYALPGLGEMVYGCAFSADGQHVFGASENGVLQMWSIRTGKVVSTMVLPDERPWCLAASSIGALLALGSRWGNVLLIDSERWCVSHRWHGSARGVARLEFSVGDRLLAMSGTGGGFSLCMPFTGERVFSHEDGEDLESSNATFSPDGTILAWGQGDGTVGLWRVAE